MADEDLKLKLGLDTSTFESSLKKASESVKGFVAGFVGISSVSAGLSYIVGEAMRAEKSLLQLRKSIENVKDGTVDLYREMKNLSTTMSETSGFAEEDILDTFKKLTDGTNSANAAIKAMQPTMDLARAKNISLAEASQIVNMAYARGTDVLRRMKINIDGNQKGMEALEAIGKKFAGNTAVYMETLEGKSMGLKNSIDELAETLGNWLLPVLKTMVDEYLIPAVRWWRNLADSIGLVNRSLREKELIEQVKEEGGIFETAKSKYEGYKGDVTTPEARALYKAMDDSRERLYALKKEYDDLKAMEAGLKDTSPDERGFSNTYQAGPETERKGLSPETISALEQENVDVAAFQQAKYDELYRIAAEGEVNEAKIREEATKKYNEWVLTTNTSETLLMAEHGQAIIEQERKKQQEIFALKKQYGDMAEFMYEAQNNKQLQSFSKGATALSALMGSKNRQMFEIGRAAAMADILVQTPKTAMDAYGAMAAIPVIGPALGVAAAAAAIAYSAERMSELQAAKFNPGGAATGLSGSFTEPLISTFQPTEVTIPENFSKGIQDGRYALTAAGTETNNTSKIIFAPVINAMDSSNMVQAMKDKIFPAFREVLRNERGDILGKVNSDGTVSANF